MREMKAKNSLTLTRQEAQKVYVVIDNELRQLVDALTEGPYQFKLENNDGRDTEAV